MSEPRSYVDDAIIRQTLRMKQVYLELLALTVGVHHLDNGDIAFLASIDKEASRLPGRVKMQSISGNPPTTLPQMNDGSLHETNEAHDLFHNERSNEPPDMPTEAADFSDSMRRQLGNKDAAPMGKTVPIPAAAPDLAAYRESEPAAQENWLEENRRSLAEAGALDGEIARGLEVVAPEPQPTHDGYVPMRGHVTPPPGV